MEPGGHADKSGLCLGKTSAVVTYMEPGGHADKSGLCLGKTSAVVTYLELDRQEFFAVNFSSCYVS